MGHVNTSVSTSLSEVDDPVVLEVSQRVSTTYVGDPPTPQGKEQTYICQYGEALLSASGGTISQAGTGEKTVRTMVTFSGSTSASLNYPNPTEVALNVLSLQATTVGETTPTIYYDSARNQIVANKPAYGVVSVTYKAVYKLWLVRFNGGIRIPTKPPILVNPGVPVKQGDPESDSEPVPPVFVVAVRNGKIKASLSVPSPSGDKKGQIEDPTGLSIMFGTDSEMPKLKMEIDPAFPVRLIPSTNFIGGTSLAAGCSIRVYPNCIAALSVTSGQLSSAINFDGVPVLETLVFSGSASQGLRYQPVNGVQLDIVSGSFVNKWGVTFTPMLIYPGGSVRVVDWVNANEFKNARVRSPTGQDEVVIADGLGNAIEAFGVLRASYSTSYNIFNFTFDWDAEKKVFKEAFIIAILNTVPPQTATLKLDPPPLNKVK